MNKFSKTSYSRHTNYNNLVSSAQQNRQKKQTFQQPSNKVYEEIEPLQSIVQKKIQIDPTLLFSAKPSSKNNKVGGNQRNNLLQHGHGDRLAETTHGGFLKSNKDRPQSKQQSRVKVPQNFSLNKNKEDLVSRPQTSKGQRNIVYLRDNRNKSLADESDHQVQVKRESKTSFGSRKRNTSKQLQLQTSIDPEFLALFAS